MDYQAESNIQHALALIRSEVASLNTTVTWAFWLAIAVLAFLPSDDIKSELSKCEAMGIAARVDEPVRRDRLLAYCMEGAGYDFRWEADGCFLHDRESCYEKRGDWRSTKLVLRNWWTTARAWAHNLK
jgi:hypothetical protein